MNGTKCVSSRTMQLAKLTNRIGPLYLLFVWTLYLVVIVHCEAQPSWKERLHFISEPDSVLAAADGRRVTYKCLVSPSTATIKWLLNGTIVSNNSYEWARLSGNKLMIKLQKQTSIDVSKAASSSPATDLQGAVFQCLAEWNNLTIVSQPAKLIIAELHPFERHEDDQVTTIVGNTAVISCHLPKSIPFAVTEYEFNNMSINYNHGRYRLLPSGNLQILEAKHTDSGSYRCVAHNPFLQEKVYASYLVNLKVVKPRHQLGVQLRNLHFVARPKENINAVIGSNITLECVVNGFPVPKIIWNRANGDLSKKRTYVEGGNLLIITLSKDDEGTYTCTANNGKTIISSAVVLEVNEIPQISEENSYEIIDVSEGQDFSLNCRALGHPKPIISWIHNGYYIDSMATNNDRGGLSFHDNNTVLRIQHADPKIHAGIFQCFATNELGTTHSIKLIDFKSNLEAKQDTQITTKNTGLHHHHHHHHHKHAHDKPSELHDSTNPSEHTDNNNIHGDGSASVGEDFENGSANEESKREEHVGQHKKKKHHKSHHHHKNQKMIPPSRPEVSKLSDDSVMVRWNVSHSSMPILFFKVQYKEKGKQDWWTVDTDIPPHILSYEVSGLKPDMIYRFRIAAVYSNDDNKNSPSSSKFILHRDSNGQPINSPTILNATPIGPNSVGVDWKFFNIDSIPLDGFLLYYRPADTVGDYTKVAVSGVDKTSFNLSHLEPNTPYEIKMRGFNTAGTSGFSNIFTVKTLPANDHGNEEINTDKKISIDNDGDKKFNEDRTNHVGGEGGAGGDRGNGIETNIFSSTLNLNNKTQWIAIFIAAIVFGLVLIVCLLTCIVRIRNPSPKVLKKSKPSTTASDYFFSNTSNSLSNGNTNNNHFERRSNGSCKMNGNGSLANGKVMVANGSPRSGHDNKNETLATSPAGYSNGGDTLMLAATPSTLTRRNMVRSPISHSTHHLYSSTANRLNEAHQLDNSPQHLSSNNNNNTATIDRKRMVKSVLDPYQDYQPSHHHSNQHHQSSTRLSSNHHSTSFTRLNGTLERKRRSRTDLNTLDRAYRPRNGTLERHSNHLSPSAQANGHIVIMQSSC